MALPTGLGHFADPGSYHGLALGIQAGLGASGESGTFGYDNLTISAKWAPGTNTIGRRISILAGFSDWQVPGYREVFADSLIDPLPDQERFGAQTTSAATLGVSFTLGGRVPFEEADIPIDAATQATLDAFILREANAESGPERRLIEGERRAFWANYIRQKTRALSRAPSFTLGMLTRLTGFAEESDVQSYDLFGAGAYGKGIVDASAAVHYLQYLDDDLPRRAFTTAAGVFLDLSDTFPTPVLGVTFGYGRYTFRELHEVIPEAAVATRDPHTDRFDVVVSFSGAPARSGQPAAGLGIRYSRINPSLLPSENVFSLVFSTNFKLLPE